MKMNNYFSKMTMLLMALLVLFSAACTEDDAPTLDDEIELTVVEFPDAKLLAQVKLALGLADDEEVTTINILDLDTLNIDAGTDLTGAISEISDLTGLGEATNLKYLHMGNTGVADLSPISGLRNIEYFRINNTPVTDLSPLSGYTSITYFNANSTTGITDISPLAGNTGLQTAILRAVPFGNEGMATIGNFTSLYRLNMRDTQVTDISVLGDLMAAGALQNSTPGADAEGGAILDLRGLAITNWLPIIPFIDNVASQDGIPANDPISVPDERLAKQIKLALGVAESTTLTRLHLLSLNELNLDASDDFARDLFLIEDLTGLEEASNLTYLHLGQTAVTDLSPIADLKKVEYLRINNTTVSDLSPISDYTTLTYFNANSVSTITDISPLAGNTGMQTLILRDVPFGDAGMATIRNFTSLFRINMRNTGVTNITVLGELMADGALLDSTPGAIEAEGGADLDLRQLTIEDWSPIEPYLDQINNIEGYPGS